MEQLLKKLQIKDAYKGQLINVPDDMRGVLADWPTFMLATEDQGLDYVLVLAKSASEIERLGPQSVRNVRDDGVIWFAYPKKSSGVKSDITRDQGWETLTEMGFRPVRQVSLSDVWSALRFREASRVK